jgi:uncharacterized protein
MDRIPMTHPLMPKATAVWLIENTALTFQQISEFCGLHILEIQSIADEEYGSRIKGSNPVISSQLTLEEIKRCELDSATRLKLSVLPSQLLKKSKKVTKKYTPLSKRQDKPDAIYFLIKKYPELQDSQICKLVGTTKSTVEAIRARNHWKINSMREIDPVISGFCKQSELEEYLKKARVRQERDTVLQQKDKVVFAEDNQPLQNVDNI